MAEKFKNRISDNAGGLLAPVSMDNSPSFQRTIDFIGIFAYKFYKQIADKKHPHFKKGAILVPTYFENRKESGLEPYVGKVMKPAKDVLLDFQNGTQHKMVVYDDGIFIDTAVMLESLEKYLKGRVKFIQRKINDLSVLQNKFIFNCTGLSSKELNKDPKMVSVQGHLIMLKNQVPQNLQYMILVYFGEDKTKTGQKIKRSFYIFPKHLNNSEINDIGVIGGTFIENATSETPNLIEFDILLNQARKFYGVQK